MQQFATAAIRPRSIAWLVQHDDWNHVESIVAYNCALLGGYFNALIPVDLEGNIDADNECFLIDYDPDLIVLAPRMRPDALESLLHRCQRLDPFRVVPWDAVSLVATDDPRYAQSGQNVPVSTNTEVHTTFPSAPRLAVLAAADHAHPDTSRLALMACGDLTRAPDPYQRRATPRETLLHGLISLEHVKGDMGPFLDETGNRLHPNPSREQLSHLLPTVHKFPLTGVSGILEACLRLQLPYNRPETFIGRSTLYGTGNTWDETWSLWSLARSPRPPGLVVLTSQRFGSEEATLFWNLRACRTLVAWLPLAEFEQHAAEVVAWLISEQGLHYAHVNGTDIAFAAPPADFAHLQALYAGIASAFDETAQGAAAFGAIASALMASRYEQRMLSRGCVSFADLLTMNVTSVRKIVSEQQVPVITNGSTCSFLPTPPTDSAGTYTVTLQSNDLMLPRNSEVVPCVLSPRGATITISRVDPSRTTLSLRQLRTTESRHVAATLDARVPRPVTCDVPSPERIADVVFTANTPYTRLKPSSVANYHRHFIDRAGSLEKAVYYLTTSPYRDILSALADSKTSQDQLAGWLLPNPVKRRALRHIDVLRIVRVPYPADTDAYMEEAATSLPSQVSELLNKGILERGFVLKCASCQYESWYPADQVGRDFRCACCYQTQVYHVSPHWLYKLPEVIYRGFGQNMKVPLLALNYLSQEKHFAFSWIPDSDLYWTQRDGAEQKQNLDIICLRDGHLLIGEAKSNDEIEAKQVSFYERVLRTVSSVDGLVFATSQAQWRPNTTRKIDELKQRWGDKIIELTGAQLDDAARRTAEAIERGAK